MTVVTEGRELIESLGLNAQNKASIGQVLNTGGIAEATEAADGTLEATITIPEDALSWEPGVLVLPHGGTLNLTIVNQDTNTHTCLLPSNGDKQFIALINGSQGTATIELDGPGIYWYSSPGGNDEGRGLSAVIVVQGEVPPEARLDRPTQNRG